jgi:hypothetical protein
MEIGWRYYRDALGQLVLLCALCVHNETRAAKLGR